MTAAVDRSAGGRQTALCIARDVPLRTLTGWMDAGGRTGENVPIRNDVDGMQACPERKNSVAGRKALLDPACQSLMSQTFALICIESN